VYEKPHKEQHNTNQHEHLSDRPDVRAGYDTKEK